MPDSPRIEIVRKFRKPTTLALTQCGGSWIRFSVECVLLRELPEIIAHELGHARECAAGGECNDEPAAERWRHGGDSPDRWSRMDNRRTPRRQWERDTGC